MSANALVATLLAMAGQRNIITVPRAFVHFTGSLESAMMLNQLLYWKPRAHGEAIYKTDLDWADELCLTRYAVRKARECLEQMGFLTVEVHHVRGAPAVHYLIDYDVLVERWALWLQEHDVKSENELYNPPSKVRKRTLPDESSSKTNGVKFENGQTMNHRVPTEITHGSSDSSARVVLRNCGMYNGTIRQVLALGIDEPTLIASVNNLVAAGWGAGAIANELRDNKPEKGHPYERPIRPDDAPDRRKPSERIKERPALPPNIKLSTWKKSDP